MTASQVRSFRKMLNTYRWYMQKSVNAETNAPVIQEHAAMTYAAFGVLDCKAGQWRIWQAIWRLADPVRRESK